MKMAGVPEEREWLQTYQPPLQELTEAEKTHFAEKGFIVLPREKWLGGEEKAAWLHTLVEEVAHQTPEAMHTYEQVKAADGSDQVVHSRTENFADYHEEGSLFLRHGPLPAVVHELAGEGVRLYKDKVNYKMAGGSGGYLPHQDGYTKLERRDGKVKAVRPADLQSPFVAYVCMVAVDDFTPENGCPQVGWNWWQQNKREMVGKTVKDEKGAIVDFGFPEMGPFERLPMRKGDVLIYDNYMPHQSDANETGLPRRALFAIYNKESDGDQHGMYYEREAQSRRAEGSANIQGKANVFFTGTPVLQPTTADDTTSAAAAATPKPPKKPQGGPSIAQKEATLRELMDLYNDGSMYGPMSQLSHALQGAKQAEDAGADDATIVGCLLHDLGWKLVRPEMTVAADSKRFRERKNEVASPSPSPASLAEKLGILSFCGIAGGASEEQQRAQHDVIGGTYLRMKGFHEKVAHLVEGHVLAKRYLSTVEPGYYEALHKVSKRTLAFQGGPMTDEEAEIFRKDLLFEECCQQRKWDEAAKLPVGGHKEPTFGYYVPHILRCLAFEPTEDLEVLRSRASFIRDGNTIVGVRDVRASL